MLHGSFKSFLPATDSVLHREVPMLLAIAVIVFLVWIKGVFPLPLAPLAPFIVIALIVGHLFRS